MQTHALPLAMSALPQPGTGWTGSFSPPSAPLCRATRMADLVTCNEEAHRPEDRIVTSLCSPNMHSFLSHPTPPTAVSAHTVIN